MTTRSMLNSLTGAILRGQIDVETARSLIIGASSDERVQAQEALSTTPTAMAAAASLGISRSTLYRRLGPKGTPEGGQL